MVGNGSGPSPSCTYESTGTQALKMEALPPPRATTSEWQGLENGLRFFKSTDGSQAASWGNFESSLDVEQEP